MNRQEHLMTILGEECSELHQELCKALRFGLFDYNPDEPASLDNAERISNEFNDLLALVDMVNIETDGIMYRDEGRVAKKREKVERYLRYSEKCGTLNP